MTRQVDAVYEGGVLRPLESLPLAEHQRVRITVSEAAGDPLESMIDREFLERARQELAEVSEIPTLEEIHRMTARDPSSWSEAIVAERERQFYTQHHK